MKEKIIKIIYAVISVTDLAFLFWGMWFQTEGFTLEYVSNFSVVITVFVGLVLAGMLIGYFIRMQKEKKQVSNKPALSEKSLGRTTIGYVVTFYIAMLLQYTAPSVAFFLGATGMMVFCNAIVIYYCVHLILKEKKAKRAD